MYENNGTACQHNAKRFLLKGCVLFSRVIKKIFAIVNTPYFVLLILLFWILLSKGGNHQKLKINSPDQFHCNKVSIRLQYF